MKIAGIQIDVAIGQTDANLEKMIGLLTQAAEAGARLIVFPECALTGYCFDSLEEARGFAQPVPGPATEQMSLACGRNESYAVFGMLEADGERVFNAAVLVGPEGVVASYRKVHLPFLGIDRFVTPGDRPFAVHEIGQDSKLPSGGVRMGMNICYDATFPESARSLSLLGADLIVTNCIGNQYTRSGECGVFHGRQPRRDRARIHVHRSEPDLQSGRNENGDCIMDRGRDSLRRNRAGKIPAEVSCPDPGPESIPFLVEIGERLPWYSRNSFLHGF